MYSDQCLLVGVTIRANPNNQIFRTMLQHFGLKFVSVLQVFVDSTMPIIEHYKARGKVRDIDATRSPDEVYQDVRPLFEDL